MNKYFIYSAVVLNIILSCVAIYRTFPAKLDIDYMGVIFTALAALVAILLVTQLVNYGIMEKHIRTLASEESRLIANDFRDSIDAITMIIMRSTLFDGINLSVSFYVAMQALEKASLCRDDGLRRITVGHILDLAYNIISVHTEQNPCLLCPGERDGYLHLLSSVDGKHVGEIKAFVANASENAKDVGVYHRNIASFFSLKVSADGTLYVKVASPDDVDSRKNH